MRGLQTLPIVADVINTQRRPMRVNEILELARDRFPCKGRTPENTIARDLALSIRDDDESPFLRMGPGLYSTAEVEYAYYEEHGHVRDVGAGEAA